MTAMYQTMFTAVLIVLGILLFFAMLRATIGPRIADRLMGINMIGTIALAMIAVLTVMKGEGYLVDVAIIYAMLSFLAVVVLVRIFIGLFRAHKETEAQKNG